MATVFDVADYILSKAAPMSAMKLQKLVYYSQAWSLAWTTESMFDEEIQAWANGPVVYDLFKEHRGRYTLSAPLGVGDPARLQAIERAVIDSVIASYEPLTAAQLSALTHSERPWQEAREGLGATSISSNPIDTDVMLEFYSGLAQAKDAVDVGSLAHAQN